MQLNLIPPRVLVHVKYDLSAGLLSYRFLEFIGYLHESRGLKSWIELAPSQRCTQVYSNLLMPQITKSKAHVSYFTHSKAVEAL